jgi:hypothetical protein
MSLKKIEYSYCLRLKRAQCASIRARKKKMSTRKKKKSTRLGLKRGQCASKRGERRVNVCVKALLRLY